MSRYDERGSCLQRRYEEAVLMLESREVQELQLTERDKNLISGPPLGPRGLGWRTPPGSTSLNDSKIL